MERAATPTGKSQSKSLGPFSGRIPVYQYPDPVYWWVIWGAAGLCALITLMFGEGVAIGEKVVKIHPNPWLGIGFITSLFLTLILVNFRARGVYAVLLVLLLLVGAVAVQFALGWGTIMDGLSLLKIHMNLATYIVAFCIAFAVWLYAILIHPRFTYWFVRPGEVGTISMSGAEETFRPQNVHVNRRGDDFFVHKVLGLSFLGIGTGDIIVDFDAPGQGHVQHVLTNVFYPKKKVELIQRLINASED